VRHAFRPSGQVWACAILCLFALQLTACSTLRFRGLTPESPRPSLEVPLHTPTLAPILLTPVPTATPQPTPNPGSPVATPTFGLPLPEPKCSVTPSWGLGDVWKNESVRTRLGCPTGEQTGVQGTEVYFERGFMISRPEEHLIYVLLDRGQAQGWGAYADTYLSSDPESDASLVSPTTEVGRVSLLQPMGRFGKLWRENAWLRDRLGWAMGISPGSQVSAAAFNGAVQDFERGVLFWNANVCFVLRTDDMSWDMY